MSDSRREAAALPPMGWNSWDCFGSSVTEDEVVRNAEFLAGHLAPFGWDTVVVDIQWYESDPGHHDYREVSRPELDEWGRPLPAVSRFPSAAGGSFRPLADRIHALGLRFGVHMMRGVLRVAAEQELPVLGAPGATCASIADRMNVCPWNPDNFGVDMSAPGAQEYYDSLAAQFADWGVDFIKLDDVLYPPVQTAEVAAFSRAIDRTGRPMVLSLSPGKQLSTAHLETLRAHAQLWRISDDLWDEWPQVREQFQRAARWAPLQQSGAWADADMLPFGRIGIRGHVGRDRLGRLTVEEQRTVMTLWCLLRSPLMFGGHLPDTPDETLALLTRREVLALREGRDAGEIVRDGDLVIWRSQVGHREYRALFWLGDEPRALRAHVDDLGVDADALSGACEDAWSGETPAVVDGWVEVDVPAHGVRLLVFG